ncbi:MAG: NUDIX hydrolase [Bacteroidia bacterium]|nr:NUDIX hydrolase [Bacteroidia bacterium]MDW8014647.1 NUDIX hydrolase [Bacteroidia bacterium]
MLRIYVYDFCLELAILRDGTQNLPTTQVLPHKRPARMIYLPSTLEKVRAAHLQAGESHKEGQITVYFPSEVAIQRFWESYRATFQTLSAAGAVVVDIAHHILFIWRRGRWDLPKGKGENGEPLEITAQRELQEETGLVCGPPERFLSKTYHIYTEGNQYFLKETAWYLFRCPLLTPPVQVQTEEGIQDYRWVSPQEIPFLYPHSYGTIRDMIEYVLREVLSAPSR